MTIEAGEKLSPQTVIQLSAQIEAIYMLANLESRDLNLIKEHQALWKRLCEFFDAAVAIWESVPSDGQLFRAHYHSLKNLQEIVRDRLEFYSISDDERLNYRRRKFD